MSLFRRFLPVVLSTALLIGAALAIVGARWNLVQAHGSDLPFNDHWDGEGILFLRPYWAGESIQRGLWIPHNEHRIVGTRLLALGLAAADGLWNARMQMLVNAGLAAAGLLVLPWALRRRLPPWGYAVACATAVLLGALPFSWENTLWGFQSQFHLLVLLGCLHLALTWRDDRCGLAWWLSLGVGLAAMFTVASGFGSAAACSAVAAWRLLRDRDGSARRFLWCTFVANAALVVAGFLLRHSVPYHEVFQAGSLAIWSDAVLRFAAWPFDAAPLGLLVQAPLLIAGYAMLVRRRLAPGEALVLAAGAWLAFQAAAIAWGRGGDASVFAVRYRDIQLAGLVLNVLCVFQLLRAAPDLRSGWSRFAIAAAWAALIGLGLADDLATASPWRGIAYREATQNAQTSAFRDYLATGDRTVLDRSPDVRAMAGTVNNVVTMLNDPGVRAHLPPSVRLPLPLEPVAAQCRHVEPFAPPAEAQQPYRAAAWRLSPTASEPAVFVSQPLPSTLLPVLRLRVRGRFGPGGAALCLVDADGRRREPLTEAFDSGTQWKTVNLLHASGGARLMVEVPAGAAPFEFTTPSDLGLATFFGDKILRLASTVGFVGGGLFLLGAIGLGAIAWRQRAPVVNGAEPLTLSAVHLRRLGAALGLTLIVGLYAWPTPHLRLQVQRYGFYLEPGCWGTTVPESFAASLQSVNGDRVHEARAQVAELPPALAWDFYGTFTEAGDAFQGVLLSQPFVAPQRFMFLLVAGYPTDSVKVELQELDPQGGVRRTIKSEGPRVGQALTAWTVDAGAAGGRWRLRIEDSKDDAFGWAGVSRPRFSSDPNIGRRLTRAFRAEWSATARVWHLLAATLAAAWAGALAWRRRTESNSSWVGRFVVPVTACAFVLWLLNPDWFSAVLFLLATTGAGLLLVRAGLRAPFETDPNTRWRIR